MIGKRAVVTGAASGMGAATVRAYVREGAAVYAVDIDLDGARAVADDAATLGPGPVVCTGCDVRKRSDVALAFDDTMARFGGLDVLANAAGIGQAREPELCSEDDLEAMLAVHMKGTMFTNQAAFQMMQPSGGAIINFGSRAGVVGAPNAPAYAAAKGAVLAWTRSTARAWGPYGVRVNAVVPMIETPMVAGYRVAFKEQEKPGLDDAAVRSIALGGALGDPDADFAPVMVFLGSDASRFITGQTLPVDGGDLILS